MSERCDVSNDDEGQDPLSNYEPAEYDTELQRALAEDTISQIISAPYLTVGPGATVREVVRTMADQRTASLLVVDEDRVLGIFTERDVLERVVEQYDRLADHPISDVMTTDPTVVYETDPAATAIAAIAIAGHRHVPVLSVDGNLKGVIAPRRVLEFIDKHYKD
jgi:CBS domain-containing protein